MSDMDLRRYEYGCRFAYSERDTIFEDPDGDYVLHSDVLPIIEEVKRLRAELAALRAQVPVWTTVTADESTLPDPLRPVLLRIGSGHDVGPDVIAVRVSFGYFSQWRYNANMHINIYPGDRWTYVPEVKP